MFLDKFAPAAAVASLALFGGAVLFAERAKTAPTRPNAATAVARKTMSPAEVVRARQTSFHLSAGVMGSLKAAIDGGADVKTQVFAARGLARWARTLPTTFPAYTAAVKPSRAGPKIWQDRAGFEAKAKDYAEAATKLADLAQAGDKAGFATQWETLRTTCSACHDAYRSPAPQ